MNSQLFNYIFDIKDIGLNIIKYLSFKYLSFKYSLE